MMKHIVHKNMMWMLSAAMAITSMFMSSCEKKDSRGDVTTITVDLGAKEHTVNLSDIADDVTFVQLEATDKSMFGNIDKLMEDKGRYVVVDKESASAIFIFDSQGHFLQKIGRKGKSKSEYIELTDAAIGNECVYVYDARSKKVVRYSFDGKYMDTYPFDYTATSFRHVSGDLFAFYCGYSSNFSLSENGKMPNLILYDFGSKELRKDLLFAETCSYDAMPVEVNNMNPYLYGSLLTDVYDIDADGAYVKAVIDYGKSYNEEQASFVKDACAGVADMNKFQYKMAEGAFPMLVNFLDCGNAYISFCVNKGRLFYNFHFLKSGKAIEGVGEGCVPVKDDMYDCITLLPKAAGDGFLYTDIEPSEVDAKMLPNVDADGNPVMVKIKLKE